MTYKENASAVEGWRRRAGKGLSPDQLLRLFELAFQALTAHVREPLGPLVLPVILSRVLSNSIRQFRVLAPLQADERGVRFEALRGKIPPGGEKQLVTALQFALTEFIAVIDRLVDRLLTPDLISELEKVRFSPAPSEASGQARNPHEK